MACAAEAASAIMRKEAFQPEIDVKKLADAQPGQHVPEKQFQQDIQQSLGKSFEQFVQAEKLNLKEGLFIYRVVVAGTLQRVNDKQEPEISPVQWIYYLVANPDGRQLSFVFSIDARQVKDFGTRDIDMVTGLEFLRPRAQPTPATERRKAK